MKTPVTDLFGIDLPIVGGGMVWMSTATLAAAVAEAGGLGLIAAGSNTPETLGPEIDRARTLTDKPVGVNIPLLYPWVGEMVEICIEKKVSAVFTSAGSPKRFTSTIQAAGIPVAHVVPNAALAVKCEQAGVDAVVAEGSEGGGHVAYDEVSTMVLTPMVRKSVKLPLITAGGIATGAQMAAAFCLGADAVQMGTRLICTEECEGHQAYKNAILQSSETGTAVTGRTFEPVRGIKNKLTEKILEMEFSGKDKNEILNFIGLGRSREAGVEGDMEWGTVQAGQVSGLVDEIIPVKTLFAQLLEGFDKTVVALKSIRD